MILIRKTIGRDPENDHVIYGDDFVSWNHCEIYKDDQGNCYIVDTDSRNGTFINGREIQKQREVSLNKGDIVKIGSESFINWPALLSVKHNTGELPPGVERKPKKEKKSINWKSILGIIMTILSLIMMIFMLLRMMS